MDGTGFEPRHLAGAHPDIGEVRRQHPKAYDRWTPEADAELLAAYRAGRSFEELAAHFQRQPSAIESRLKKLALEMLRRSVPASSDDASG